AKDLQRLIERDRVGQRRRRRRLRAHGGRNSQGDREGDWGSGAHFGGSILPQGECNARRGGSERPSAQRRRISSVYAEENEENERAGKAQIEVVRRHSA